MNKKTKIIYITILLLIAFQFNVFTQLTFYSDRLDFFWNYNFGLQITNGLIPYNDFNMVITPLFPLLVSIFLCIFSKNIIVYIIFTSILKTLIAALVSKLVIDLTPKNQIIKFTITFTIVNLLLYSHYFEYNYFSVLLILLIILLDQENQSKKINILLREKN